MLKRLYVDNYKCMVNFEFVPQATQLILGANGAGKSSVFDVLLMLRRFITGQDKLERLVDVSTLTAWDKRTQQTFEPRPAGRKRLLQLQVGPRIQGRNEPMPRPVGDAPVPGATAAEVHRW